EPPRPRRPGELLELLVVERPAADPRRAPVDHPPEGPAVRPARRHRREGPGGDDADEPPRDQLALVQEPAGRRRHGRQGVGGPQLAYPLPPRPPRRRPPQVVGAGELGERRTGDRRAAAGSGNTA